MGGWVGGWAGEWEGVVEIEGRCRLGTPTVWDDMPSMKHTTELFSHSRDHRRAVAKPHHSYQLAPHFVLLQTV